MLFKLLKLFGLDVRAEFAAVKGQIEQRVEEAAGRARHAALAVAVIAATPLANSTSPSGRSARGPSLRAKACVSQ